MPQLKYVIAITLAAVFLSACAPTPSPSSTPAPNDQSVIESTGDPEQDAAAIESELQSLDESTDFPDIKAADFSL